MINWNSQKRICNDCKRTAVTSTDVFPVDDNVPVSVLPCVFMPEAESVQELMLDRASSVTCRTSQEQVQRTKVVISDSCRTSTPPSHMYNSNINL